METLPAQERAFALTQIKQPRHGSISSFSSFVGTLILLAIGAGQISSPASELGDGAPWFTLPRFGLNETVSLEDFRGSVVVLDFFAYWCVPCRRASKELEDDIQKFYEAKHGNQHGLPVRVISINIEKEFPARTSAFIKQAGSSLVLEDADGAVLKQYGGAGIPFFVVIDGTASQAGAALWRIAYRNAGYEGSAKLRQIIDSIGPGARAAAPLPAIPKSPAAQARTETGKREWTEAVGQTSAIPIGHLLETGFEALAASGVTLTESGLGYRQTRPKTEFSVTTSYATMDLDYKPAAVDIITEPANLAENRLALQGNFRRKVLPSLTWLGTTGGYDGYSDYRSLWLNEYYRQYYSSVPGYKKAHPRGYNVSAGVRWEYLPTAGFFQLDASYSRDDVSPGYEIVLLPPPRFGSELLGTRETLHTAGLRLSFENVLTSRIRTLNEFQVADTTDRSARFTYQGSVNWAATEHWVLRSVVGLSMERPDFHSFSLGTTLERDWNQRWFVSLFGRYYQDNGEIDNPQLINSASPALETVQAGIGLRWQGLKSSCKIIVGPYLTRYAPVAFGTEPFAKLYRDRGWFSVQAAFTYTF